MMHHYQDLGSASDWSCHLGNLIQSIRSTHHQYEISALVSQTSFGGETRGSIAKCWLFSQAKAFPESTELLTFSHSHHGRVFNSYYPTRLFLNSDRENLSRNFNKKDIACKSLFFLLFLNNYMYLTVCKTQGNHKPGQKPAQYHTKRMHAIFKLK